MPGTVSNDLERLIQGIYALALNRSARAEEAEVWAGLVQGGMLSVGGLVAEIASSAEAESVRERRAAVGVASSAIPSGTPDDSHGLITRVYELALDRSPNENDLAFWAGLVQNGSLSVGELVAEISSSAEAEAVREHRQALRNLKLSHASAQPNDIEGFVRRTYTVVLDRQPTEEEVAAWSEQLRSGDLGASELFEQIASSPEAQAVRERGNILPAISDGRFVQAVYEIILDRGAAANEIVQWEHLLRNERFGRDRMILALFADRAERSLDPTRTERVDPGYAQILGTNTFVSAERWLQRMKALEAEPASTVHRSYPGSPIEHTTEIAVSAIASLYKGGEYIRQFLDNITTQSIFATHCELIIIDANSPEGEAETIGRYVERFPNIVYHRTSSRIGIYDAWNLGVEKARGRYLTNTNLDDLRRQDSFERQVEVLEKFPFVDVVYQDFLYSFDGHASVEKTARIDTRSELPIITPYNLMGSNSPHNAPMWRKELHSEIGLFDTTYRSAGDYDFWLRCVIAGKVFFKINDPHVVYYVNPDGLSTQPNTRGIDEANHITKVREQNIVSPNLVSSPTEFARMLNNTLGSHKHSDEWDTSTRDWRYKAVQNALRQCSVSSRPSAARKD